MGLFSVFERLLRGPWGATLATIWGSIWGSFTNVMIVRLPGRESVAWPGSHCRSCGAELRWWDNIPILSYLALRGRCRHCHAHYSAVYLAVEVLLSAISLLLHHKYLSADRVISGLIDGGGWISLLGVHGDFILDSLRFVVGTVFAGLLIAVAFIDFRTMRIPNAITYPAIPTCVALSFAFTTGSWWQGIVGAGAGYAIIRAVADGWKWATGRQGMGYGDAKLLSMIGGLLGWQVLLPVLLLASLQGSLIGIGVLWLLRRRHPTDKDPLRHAKIPFGPFLSVAALEVLLCDSQIGGLFPYLILP